MCLPYLVFPCELLEKVEVLEIVIMLLQFSVNQDHS